MASVPFLDADHFERARVSKNVRWGRPLRLHEEVTSTNDLAMEAALAGMKTGGVFVARKQTGGRGRRGNSWTSAPGENLTFSLVLRLPLPPEKISGLSLVAGVALARASEEQLAEAGLSCPVTVKWPNDVYIGDEKLAGILVELRTQSTETVAVVGIGWNVSQTNFPKETGHPTSFARQGLSDKEHLKEELLLRFLAHFEASVSLWLRGGVRFLHAELNSRDALNGRAILVDNAPGVARGISEDGSLLVEFEKGSVMPVLSGHIELIRG